ncbi:Uncharacterised protein [BD1-7 clade bacterium]|uniref:Uncharacterized protein n=1 Tax=BD1-7 clade bacterium TaxID=2029982 RepID=A0A5S9QQZ1_9GAMM|nr:Uncharacterised protein [BD1-7 clade bacterium]CAA0120827.1 Uncharacterised protein [BD1-7 clade bacterium]
MTDNQYANGFVSDRAGISILDFLADETPLSKSCIKQVAQVGGVWRMPEDGEPERVHRVKEQVKLGDEIHIYYDAALVNTKPFPMELVQDFDTFSIWKKPASIMPEQSLYCDHLSLERAIGRDTPADRDCYWAYPMQPEIGGLILLVHAKNIAAKLAGIEERGGVAVDISVLVPDLVSSDGITLIDGSVLALSNAHDQASGKGMLAKDAQGYEDDLVEWATERMEGEADISEPINHILSCSKISFTHPANGENIITSLSDNSDDKLTT